mmetsp:Transcript_7118/g.19898  ORF Transcript_7118/g.19898 Transcript_7118/m.19898 type:complete len:328 (+) Transcript_7118:1075-2058(+)
MINVSPSCRSTAQTLPVRYSANVFSRCDPRVHRLNASKFFSVGGAKYMRLAPRSTWYHTLVPPKSTWKSVKLPATLMSTYLRTRGGESSRALFLCWTLSPSSSSPLVKGSKPSILRAVTSVGILFPPSQPQPSCLNVEGGASAGHAVALQSTSSTKSGAFTWAPNTVPVISNEMTLSTFARGVRSQYWHHSSREALFCDVCNFTSKIGMSDFGQVALATSRGDNDGFGILNPRLALWGFLTITGTSNPFLASSTVTVSFSTWGDEQVAWESNRSLNAGWSNNSLPSSPTAAWRWARARRPCFLAGIFFYGCGRPAAAVSSSARPFMP